MSSIKQCKVGVLLVATSKLILREGSLKQIIYKDRLRHILTQSPNMYSLAIFLAVISAAVSTPLVGYPNCHPTSKTVDLRISDLYFHSSRVYSTPAHQVAGGSISFNITNPAAGITTSCSASSTQIYDYFYGDLWYHCQKTDGVDDTEFTFNRTTGQINLTQRWTCKDPSSP